MDALLVGPIVIPLLAAIACLLLWSAPAAQRVVTAAAMAALTATALVLLVTASRHGIQVTQVGSWPAPFGIPLVADLLSSIMLAIAAIIGLMVAIYSLVSIDPAREAHGYYALFNVLLMGISGAFLTGDMFNLFVWFEVMLIASFVLIALGGERAQLDGATKYVSLNMLSSTLFLSALGILYGMAGTLNMADLSGRLDALNRPALVTTVAVMFLVAFGIKAALFPLFFWLPASYHTPPAAVSAVFAGLLTKVGVYALFRVFTLVFTQDTSFTHTLILVLSGLTMITGVLGAVSQGEFRRILSFHIVSQIGYMTMGLGLFSRLALAGSIFYIVHHIVVKTNLFLISGIAQLSQGSYELNKLGGLYRERPGLACLFLVAALSLAGLPPLSGFWGKFFLVEAGFALDQYAIVAVALAVGFLTLYSMTKIWNEAFWKEPPADDRKQTERTPGRPSGAHAPELRRNVRVIMFPIVVLASLTLTLGMFTAPFYDLALRAADQLLDPLGYVQAVMNTQQ